MSPRTSIWDMAQCGPNHISCRHTFGIFRRNMLRSSLVNRALLRYIAKRIASAAVVLVLISFFAFMVIQLPPGDFLDSYVANLSRSGMAVASSTLVALRHASGLDRPMIVQY